MYVCIWAQKCKKLNEQQKKNGVKTHKKQKQKECYFLSTNKDYLEMFLKCIHRPIP